MSSLIALSGFPMPAPNPAAQAGGTPGGRHATTRTMTAGGDANVSGAFAALLAAAFDGPVAPSTSQQPDAETAAVPPAAVTSADVVAGDAAGAPAAEDAERPDSVVDAGIPGFTWAPPVDVTGTMQEPGTVTIDAWLPEPATPAPSDIPDDATGSPAQPATSGQATPGPARSAIPDEVTASAARSATMDEVTASPAPSRTHYEAPGSHASIASVPLAPTPTILAAGVEKLEGVDPAFRAALERTIGRMTAEGHSVRIIETSRTQQRQDALFAQGRSAPGPIVTWTRQSRHLVGRAADLQVDGAWTGTGYARLQAIAREEGLHTLGARDPGHVELKVAAHAAPVAAPAVPAPVERPRLDRAGDAAVLVAARARATQLIRALGGDPVTTRATPGERGGTARARDRASLGVEPASLALLETLDAPPAWAEEAAPEQPAWPDAPSPEQSAGFDVRRPSVSTTESRARIHDLPATVTVPEPARPVALLTQRIEQLLAQREQARGGPMASITLAVDAANGTTDRVRIGLTGRQLGATILTDDPAAARAMSRDLGGLSEALARTGVDGSAVTVHDVASAAARQGARPAEGQAEAAHASVGARLGAVDATRPANPSGGDAGAEQRRHEREQPQRHGGDSPRQQGEQRDSQHRRQRRDQDEQRAAGAFRFPFPR